MHVDVSGPHGNSFHLLALAKAVLTKAGRQDELPDILADALSGDYAHLLAVLSSRCGFEFTEGGDDACGFS